MPNAGPDLHRLDYRVSEWDADFRDYLKRLESERQKPVVLAGDLNVAHTGLDIYEPTGKETMPGYSPEERESFTKLLESGFIDTYRELYPD